MSIEDDVALLGTVPTLRLLGREALRMLAIGSETREVAAGDVLFARGEPADCGYVVQSGSFRLSFDDGSRTEMIAGPGALMGELALIVAITRPSTAVALEQSTVIRLARAPFQRVLEIDPDAAVRLRDEIARRTTQVASDILLTSAKLTS